MANPVPANFTVDCYSLQTLSPHQQKALKVYALALWLKAEGGTDYTTALATTLFSDTAAATIGLNQARRDAARVKILFTLAAQAGASVPAGISSKFANINQLLEVPDEQLDNMEVYLLEFLTQYV